MQFSLGLIVLVMFLLPVGLWARDTEASKRSPARGLSAIQLFSEGSDVFWRVEGYSPDGYKLVWSLEPDPVYPPREGDEYAYIDDPYILEYTIEPTLGEGLYYLRIGEYINGEWGISSNVVEVDLSGEDPYAVEAIWLEVEGNRVSWTIDGFSEYGYKVVWSQSPEPEYPCRSSDRYLYIDDPYRREAVLEAFDGPGIYYVRVGEYLGGRCGLYSNEERVYLTE